MRKFTRADAANVRSQAALYLQYVRIHAGLERTELASRCDMSVAELADMESGSANKLDFVKYVELIGACGYRMKIGAESFERRHTLTDLYLVKR